MEKLTTEFGTTGNVRVTAEVDGEEKMDEMMDYDPEDWEIHLKDGEEEMIYGIMKVLEDYCNVYGREHISFDRYHSGACESTIFRYTKNGYGEWESMDVRSDGTAERRLWTDGRVTKEAGKNRRGEWRMYNVNRYEEETSPSAE